MRARLWLPIGIAGVALIASGCGGGTDEAEPEGGATIPIQITAANFAFAPDAIDVEPGELVEIVLVNEDDTAHSFTAEGIDLVAQAGESISGELTASAVDIPFRCKFHPQVTGLLSTEGTTGGGGAPTPADQDIDY